MRDINTVRKAGATMANQLYKLGYSLSQAFKTAWKRVKNSMRCRVSSVTYEKRQQLLQFIASRKQEDLTVYLQRDRANTFDKNPVERSIFSKAEGEEDNPHRRALTEQEQQLFLKCAEKRKPFYADIFYVGFSTGMRVVEINALEWQDIDFSKWG